MTMKISDLVALFSITKDEYDEYDEYAQFVDILESKTLHEYIQDAVQRRARIHYKISMEEPLPDELKKNIDKVVTMYLEIISNAPIAEPLSTDDAGIYPGTQRGRSLFSSTEPGRRGPFFSYTDRSWNFYNTTHQNQSGRSPDDRSTNEPTLEERLAQLAIMVGSVIVGAIAVVSFGYLASEMANHISRIYHNEGTVQGFMLLTGVGLSYCLAALTLYEVAGGLLMAAMTAAAFVHPAAWAVAIIALGAVIATPVFNMVIREGIYGLFSMFDSQALVKEDNRFRGLTLAEEQSLPRDIDPDRVHFSTLCKHAELKSTQTRQRFAFFDYNSNEMNAVIHAVRAMRNPEVDAVQITAPGNDASQARRFSLRRPTVWADASSLSTPVASACSDNDPYADASAPCSSQKG